MASSCGYFFYSSSSSKLRLLIGRGQLTARRAHCPPTSLQLRLASSCLQWSSAPLSTSARPPLGLTGIEYDKYLSPTSRQRGPTAIRQLTPLGSLPGMIDLGGGMPSPSTFPIKKLAFNLDGVDHPIELSKRELDTALQYSPTPGLPDLLNTLTKMQTEEHKPPGVGGVKMKVIVTNGSQEALFRAFEMLLTPTSSVLVEAPTYSSCLSILRPMGCKIVGVATDSQGLVPSSLREILHNWPLTKGPSKPRILYTVPTGANPSGTSLSLERKKEIYRIAREHQLLILEDDPYYYLTFGNARIPSFLSLDVDGRVLRFDSMSKILSSGLRIGYATGPAPLIQHMELIGHVSTLHASTLSQMLVNKILHLWGKDGFEKHVNHVSSVYKGRRDFFVDLCQMHLQDLADWHVPDAGMFIWLKLRGVEDSFQLITSKAVAEKVLMVPGNAFHADEKAPSPYVRAAYSTVAFEEMDIALQRLKRLLEQHHKNKVAQHQQ